MRFARGIVARMSAGIHLATEMKLSCFPYQLLRMRCPDTHADVKVRVRQQLAEARGCCLGPFGRRFREVLASSQESCDSAISQRALDMWNSVQRLSTAPVEREHKKMKDELCSVTSGALMASAGNRLVCRHLQAAHLQRGFTDVSVDAAGTRHTKEGPHGRPLMDFNPAITARGDAPVEPLDFPASSREGSLAPGEIAGIEHLGGGNPKVCYINHKIRTKAQSHDGTTRAVIEQWRKSAAEEYDRSPHLQTRWKGAFKYVVDRRRERRSNSSIVAETGQSREAPVWESSMQLSRSRVRGPVDNDILVDFRSSRASTRAALNRLALEDSDMKVSEDGASRPQASGRDSFACGTNACNVCRGALVSTGLSQRFAEVKHAWNGFIDSVDRANLRECMCLFAVHCTTDGGVQLWAWYLVAKAIQKPKVQVLLPCYPSIVAGPESQFVVGQFDPPYRLTIASGPSRMCEEAAANTLRHFTSETIIFDMLRRCTRDWHIILLEWEFPVPTENLLVMDVIGQSIPVGLRSTKRKRQCSAFDALLEMQHGSARIHGRARARRVVPPSTVAETVPIAAEVDDADEECGDWEQDIAELRDAALHENWVGVDDPCFDLEGALEDMLGEFPSEAAGPRDEDPASDDLSECSEGPASDLGTDPTERESGAPSIVAGAEADSGAGSLAEDVMRDAGDAAEAVMREGPDGGFPEGTIFTMGGAVSITPHRERAVFIVST